MFVQGIDGTTTIKLGLKSTTDGSPVKLAGSPKVYGDLVINMKDGDDFVLVNVGSSLEPNSNATPTSETPLEAIIGRNLKINTGRGQDQVVVETNNNSRLTVGNDLTVDLGADYNMLALYGAPLGSPASQPQGPPTPQTNALHIAGNAKINGGSGMNDITLVGVSTGNNLKIETLNGDDVVQVVNALIGGNIGISTGGDDDTVAAAEVAVFGHSNIATGSGDDHVIIQNAYSQGDVSVRLGQGTDTLEVTGDVSVGKHATVTLDGGDGHNENNEIDTFLTDNPNSDLAHRAMIIGFEQFGPFE